MVKLTLLICVWIILAPFSVCGWAADSGQQCDTSSGNNLT